MSQFTTQYPVTAFMQPSLLEQRIEVLRWHLDGKPARTNLRQLILGGLIEKPLTGEHKDYERFLKLAIAVAVRDGLTPLDTRCYIEWKGRAPRKCASIVSDPEIHRLLGYGELPLTGVMRQWLRHDWNRFKRALYRIFS